MSYQVLARKWRPQRFDDVIGQQAVTRTLRNALTSGRIAQAFVFAGPRGCGKTTTARILARALNCEQGPTPDPCGSCDACTEIAQGRDMDVLEIDAASHTGIDNIREVVIAGLAITPARDRYKIFIIDEVHQLSISSFNALLKSIEEPPAHVAFVMATTELHKIPDTILSRSQVFEFRAISTAAISAQLRTIADAEQMDIPDVALTLIARSAEGSMRDAQGALDQVIAFAGTTATLEDVSTVLGLVGQDLLFDIVEAVVDEDAPRAFALADRAVESGHELRLVCRELAGLVREMMIVSVDPGRIDEAEVGEADRVRLTALASRFSREDLMRSFDVLSRAEFDIRTAAQPRYHFEMALLRWMHTRKLVPLTDLLEQLGGGGSGGRLGSGGRSTPAGATATQRSAPVAAPAASRGAGTTTRSTTPAPVQTSSKAQELSASSSSKRAAAAVTASASKPAAAPASSRPGSGTSATTAPAPAPAAETASESAGAVKDAFLAEIRSSKGFFYNTVVAQAQRIDVTADGITFSFLPTHRALREQLEETRDWLEQVAERLVGRRVHVVAVQTDAPDAPPATVEPAAAAPAARDLKSEALASSAVQAMLDVFPAEIRDVEEM